MTVDRHLRIAFLVTLPLVAIVGVSVNQLNWDEWIMWVAFAVITAVGLAIVTRGVPKLPPDT